ncbi:MAG TPA: translocation/assembly module TamB domain-containing protein [Gemmatimonadaceae bacterium]|jgi:translocation and assembly module TamB
MARRRHVALASAIVILLMGSALAAMLGGLTRSTAGREWIRAQVQRVLAGATHGTIHVGALGGSFFTGLTIDSLEFREPNDSLFLATGPVRLTYDPRDIVDGVIALRSLDVQRPFVRLQRRHDEWNYRSIFPEGPPSTGPRRGFGSRIALSNVRIRGGEVRVQLPWTPADSLHGVRRDSAIAAALADTVGGVHRIGPNEYEKVWKWSGVALQLAHAHVADPDTSGHHFEIARLDVTERYPPFNVRNARGTVWRRGDSLWVDIPRFDLPGSNGSAKGKVVWGHGLPTRYDIHVRGDSVSMRDVAWVWTGLPVTGGGRMDLHIRNERDLHVMDYVLTNMDIRSTNSHLRGSMTFGVGAPVLIVKDVALEALPLDFKLIERFNGEPLPLPWRGAITGTVRARGGPVNRWRLDDGRFTFADANVPGAITRGTMRGELDILFPAFTAFHGATVELAQLDLRTLQALDTSFARLNGLVAGRAVLDSSWLDVRFSDADITHHDGDSPVSHFTGSGRVTWGEKLMTYDLRLAALPLSLTAIARSYPGLPARGEYSGPLRVKGTTEDLGVVADLVGDAGRLEVDGSFDVNFPVYRATARGGVSGIDLPRFLDRRDLPHTSLGMRWSADISGDSLPNLRGTAALNLDRSLVDSVRIFGGGARVRFLAGTLAVDTLDLESAAFSVLARGRLALAPGRAGDSVTFRVALDSLGGFRRTLARLTGAGADSATRAEADTEALDGVLRLDGAVAGTWPAARVNLAARGRDVHVGTNSVRELEASARLQLPMDSLRGQVRTRFDGVTAGTVRLDALTADLDLPAARRGSADVRAEFANGPVATARADLGWSRDTTDVRLDRLRLSTADNDWALLNPSRLRRDAGGWHVDSLVMVGRTAGRIALRGNFPDSAAVNGRVDVREFPLRDFGELMQAATPMAGSVSVSAAITGTRDAPEIALDATLHDATVAGMKIERATATGRYARQVLDASVRTMRKDVTALRLDASLPVDLTLRPVSRRLLEYAPLRAQLRSDSAGVVLLETLTSAITEARGSLALDLNISGTLHDPRATGALRVNGGGFEIPNLGTTWRDLDVDVRFLGDSIVLGNISARSGGAREGRAAMSGWLGVRDLKNPRFALLMNARGFNVINKPRVADIDLTGELRVAGAKSRSTLTGALTVDRGTIYIPDIYSKNLISLDDLAMIDTTALADHGILPRAPSSVIENLSIRDVPVTMGRDVTLRSNEANITLGGSVRITAAQVQRGRNAERYQLALSGTLQTLRGSYRLNAGPVQRTFDVEGGEVRFRGDPDPNLAEMDIRALHTVRTFSQNSARQDVRVRVNIYGTLGSPLAKFSTPDSNRVADSDILSYLITGGPSNEILGTTGGARTTAARVVLSSFGSVIGSKVPTGLCTDAQVTTAGLDQYTGGLRDVGSSILSGSRFNCAKQLTERAFVRLDAGLCSIGQLLGQGGSFDPLTLTEAMGLKVDYRFNYGVSASAGLDPSTSAALCTRDAVVRGFVPTPRQFGFDLFRAWQF